ncbi:hypothetical protein [Haliscomenobacter sp.]|uniref:hypothetical protein n=1 Tax=Haliscomenobacter sp. TaxID=2717303 RepID=UPI0035933F6E
MVPELRKRHRLIWQIGSVVILIGFVGAIVVLPQPVTQTKLFRKIDLPLPRILDTQESEELTINLRGDSTTGTQLEFIIKKPLEQPVAKLYWQYSFIGVLGSKGIQRFPVSGARLAKAPYFLQIVNPFEKTGIQKFNFNP